MTTQRGLTGLAAAVLGLLAWFGSFGEATAAQVIARIDLSDQSMNVYVDGRRAASWPVSTARRGYRTPVGTFRPGRMHKRYFSKKYHNSPMPYSVFFHGGYAIHGTNAVRALGRPASHGCVRLHPENARALYSMIERYGKQNARIVITR
jgi:lipoprotein-anchoring transpeptidase ErfK/SrfK